MPAASRRPRGASAHPATSGLRLLLRAVVLVVFLGPVVFMAAHSLRGLGQPPPTGLELVPSNPSFDSYRELDDVLPLRTLVGNSAFVVAVAVPVTVLLASWAGFALAQLGDRVRRPLVAAVVALLVLPLPLLWVPRFALYLEIGALDTLAPLMAPAVAATTPFTVLLCYRAFRRVDPHIWSAARLEGASALFTWWRVGLPLVRATTTAVAAITFAAHWGNYLEALLYARVPDVRTLPLGVGELSDLTPAQLPIQLAAAVLLTLPPLVLLLGVQRPLLQAVDASPERH